MEVGQVTFSIEMDGRVSPRGPLLDGDDSSLWPSRDLEEAPFSFPPPTDFSYKVFLRDTGGQGRGPN